MKAFLFLELTVIFATSFLLTVQLFYNCLNETHFMALGLLGGITALVALVAGYSPSPTTVALYFALAICAVGFFLYHLAIGYIVYDFGEKSRNVFIEKEVTSILRNLPKYAERSKEKYNSYEHVCRSENFAFVPTAIENAHSDESCYGPLAFLLFDKKNPPKYFTCEADEAGWRVESQIPDEVGYLCIDTRRQVLTNELSREEEASCR
jgi:hypothetical protein